MLKKDTKHAYFDKTRADFSGVRLSSYFLKKKYKIKERGREKVVAATLNI
jgi:hypothetical protein